MLYISCILNFGNLVSHRMLRLDTFCILTLAINGLDLRNITLFFLSNWIGRWNFGRADSFPCKTKLFFFVMCCFQWYVLSPSLLFFSPSQFTSPRYISVIKFYKGANLNEIRHWDRWCKVWDQCFESAW